MSAISQVISFEEKGSVGVIRLDHPPVNALSCEVRTGIIDGVAAAKNRPQIKVILIISGGNLFSAGADLREFDTGLVEPSLQSVQAAVEMAPLPVVAAIHGLALGGGLELAMACHYRIAHKNAKLGLPEVNLGIIPGAGGTQRLPRLIGAHAALEMILSGTPIPAAEAKAKGLVDEVVEGELIEAALAYCQRFSQGAVGLRPTCKLPPAMTLSGFDITEALKANAKALRGRTTQTFVIEAIRASALPFSEGLEIEAALARQSLASRESEALRHIFFAERESGKIADLPPHDTLAEINHVAIIGAGTMGSAIAIAFADAGRKVTLLDNSEAAVTRSQEHIRSSYASSVKRGRIVQHVADERISRITLNSDLAAAAHADVVIEAVFEDMDLKKEILFRLDAMIPSGRLIASNTSTLSVTELGRATKQPGRVLGLHFFSPANVTKLLEIVRGRDTTPEALATALQVARLLKKVPVVSGDAFGFIGNRMMLDGYFREAEQLLLEGASPAQVDVALEKFGFAMGPQRVSDLGGNDVGTKVRLQLYKRESRPDPYFVVADRLTELGRLGQKTGRGFYRYEPGGREALPDPEVITLIEALAGERAIIRREIRDDEIVERCLLALINVGAMVLEEGIASRAADIDVVWTSGYGFPRHLGGPMFHADTLGLFHVAERIRHYHEKLGHYWRPAKLIERLAAEKSTFAEWDRALPSR
ncbi:MAG TPA: 3-hydroxyacyl-CoA dehydrogenase NAD-binding domain-containing protein [Terriglobales bacterium]|nr:3-hydroxyacyl-CoA dehydrogenase NAD-binding domain-containing protein [Terriglobales bacterium]